MNPYLSRPLVALFGALLSLHHGSSVLRSEVLTFEGLLGPNSFNNGGPITNANGFTQGTVFLPNSFDSRFGGFWSGWSISSVANATTPGFGNQYAAFPGGGSNSPTYGVAFGNTYLSFTQTVQLHTIDLANTTYAALSMRDGDRFSKKFGGATGNDPDLFRVTLRGYSEANRSGNVTGSIFFDLADYRFADNSLDFIRSDWTRLDLSGLGLVRSIGFEFTSTDVGEFGINTPTYFAMDNLNLTAVPEPPSHLLLGGMALLASIVPAFSRFLPRRGVADRLASERLRAALPRSGWLRPSFLSSRES